MAQQVAANGLAESVMAFNTNYSDSGLFGVYAVAKVWFSSFELLHLIAWPVQLLLRNRLLFLCCLIIRLVKMSTDEMISFWST